VVRTTGGNPGWFKKEGGEKGQENEGREGKKSGPQLGAVYVR